MPIAYTHEVFEGREEKRRDDVELYEVAIVLWRVDKTIDALDKRIGIEGDVIVKHVAAKNRDHAHTKSLIGVEYEESDTTEIEVLVKKYGM